MVPATSKAESPNQRTGVEADAKSILQRISLSHLPRYRQLWHGFGVPKLRLRSQSSLTSILSLPFLGQLAHCLNSLCFSFLAS